MHTNTKFRHDNEILACRLVKRLLQGNGKGDYISRYVFSEICFHVAKCSIAIMKELSIIDYLFFIFIPFVRLYDSNGFC